MRYDAVAVRKPRRQPLLLVAIAAGGLACPGEAPHDQDRGGYLYDAGLALVEAGAHADLGHDAGKQADRGIPADALPADHPAPAPDTGATATGAIGDPCTYNEQCQYGICAQNTHTGQRFCTALCDPCAAQPCPEGSGCQNAGPAYICAPGYPNAPCP